MGTFYSPSGPIPTDKDYDVVKTVPPGMILYNVNDPINFAFGPGTTLKLRNGIIVNTPDSNWALEDIETYRAKFLQQMASQEQFLQNLKQIKEQQQPKQQQLSEKENIEIEQEDSDLEERYKAFKTRLKYDILFGSYDDKLNQFLGFNQVLNLTGLALLLAAKQVLEAKNQTTEKLSLRNALNKVNELGNLEEVIKATTKFLSNEERGLQLTPGFIKEVLLFLLKTSDKNALGLADINFDKDLLDDLSVLLKEENLSTLQDNLFRILNFNFFVNERNVYKNLLLFNLTNKFSKQASMYSLSALLKLAQHYPEKVKLVSPEKAIEDFIENLPLEEIRSFFENLYNEYDHMQEFLGIDKVKSLFLDYLDSLLKKSFFSALDNILHINPMHVIAIRSLLEAGEEILNSLSLQTLLDPDDATSSFKEGLSSLAKKFLQDAISEADQQKDNLSLALSQFLFSDLDNFSADAESVEKLYEVLFGKKSEGSVAIGKNLYELYDTVKNRTNDLPQILASSLLASPYLLAHLRNSSFTKTFGELIAKYDADYVYYRLMLSRRTPIKLGSTIERILQAYISPNPVNLRTINEELNNLSYVLDTLLDLGHYEIAQEVVLVGSSLANLFSLLERDEAYITEFPFMKFLVQANSFAEKIRTDFYEILSKRGDNYQIEALKDILLYNDSNVNIEVNKTFFRNAILDLFIYELESKIGVLLRRPEHKEKLFEITKEMEDILEHLKRNFLTPFFDPAKFFTKINRTIDKILSTSEEDFPGETPYILRASASTLATIKESLLALSTYYPKPGGGDLYDFYKRSYVAHLNLVLANFLNRYSNEKYDRLNNIVLQGPINVFRYELKALETGMPVLTPYLQKDYSNKQGSVFVTPIPTKTYIPASEIRKMFSPISEKEFFENEKLRGMLASILAVRSLNLAKQLVNIFDISINGRFYGFKDVVRDELGEVAAKELVKVSYENFKNFSKNIKNRRHIFDHLFSDVDDLDIEVTNIARTGDTVTIDIKIGEKEFSIYTERVHPFVVIEAFENSGVDLDSIIEEFLDSPVDPIAYAIPRTETPKFKISPEALVKSLLKHSSRHFVALNIAPKGKPFVASTYKDSRLSNASYRLLYGATSDWRENLTLASFLHDVLDTFVPENYKDIIKALYKVVRLNFFYTGWYFFNPNSNDLFLSLDYPIMQGIDLANWKEDYTKYKDIVEDAVKELINDFNEKEYSKRGGNKYAQINLDGIVENVLQKHNAFNLDENIKEKVKFLTLLRYAFVETVFHEAGHALWDVIDPGDDLIHQIYMQTNAPMIKQLSEILRKKRELGLAATLDSLLENIPEPNTMRKYNFVSSVYSQVRDYLRENFDRESEIAEFVKNTNYIDIYGLIIPHEIPSTVLEKVFMIGEEEFLKKYPQYSQVLQILKDMPNRLF